MPSITVTTKPITREKLAKFFPGNHELVRLLETLSQDVTVNIPDATDPALDLLDEVQGTAEFAAAIGRLAQGIAIQALALAKQANDGPPATPAPITRLDDAPPVLAPVLPDIPDDVNAQIAGLRERLAVAERAIAQMKEGPTP